MLPAEWKSAFIAAAESLGEGEFNALLSPSWCSWTTFSRLASDAGYWTAGLPKLNEIGDSFIHDGGVWGQPFSYSDIAHLIIPAKFFWESSAVGTYSCGEKEQNIKALSVRLASEKIPHRLTPLVLEIKVF
ncbi:MAG: hypothetical protein D3M94_21800 [Rhodocyclales bacterium GT-UBC]|nr:MAG: hypothetical protein D3M94_21800 [Rhodocyclales bacterium GT-UBC]